MKKRFTEEQRENLVRAEGVEPSQAFRPCGFSCRLRLSPPGRRCFSSAHARFAVWTIPSPSPGWSGLRRCPSSLYTFPAGFLRAWLGIAIAGFPEFEQFCIAGFPCEHSSFA